jgi:hypothetical protein
MDLEIDAPEICLALQDELEDAEVSVTKPNKVVVFESYAAGMWYPEYFDEFEERIEQFVMEYTKDWYIAHTSSNNIEGTHSAILKKRS